MRDYNKEFQNNDRKYSFNFDQIMREYMFQTFEPLVSKGNALELGCFQGDFTEILSRYFEDITVVEASSELAEHVQNRFGARVKVITSTFETVNLEEKYDAIFLVHTLEHLDDPVSTLATIKSWLSDKGLLFVAVPNANAPSRQIAVKMGLISHNTAITPAEFEHGHRITYTLDTLERDITGAGLNIVQRGGVFFKALANFQFDSLLENKMLNEQYLDGCYKLGMQYPDLCASIYMVCKK